MKPKILHLRNSYPLRNGLLRYFKQKSGTWLLFIALCCLSLTQALGQVAQILPPTGGFHIDGDLKANTPTAGIGDWVSGAGGSGGFLINNNGSPVDPLLTYNLQDPYNTNTDIIFTGGSKVNDDPAVWSWSNQSPPPKNDINRGLIHIGKDANNDIWLIMAGDRLSTNGDSYIDFELLQNTMTRNTTNGHFNSAGPDGGRTVNDLLITIQYSNGGGVSNIIYQKWLPNGSGGFSYQVITPGPLGFAMTNTGTVDVPFGAFGNTTYGPLQFVEAAVNLSQVIHNTINSCQGLDIKTLFIKTKASTSPTAELKDFIEPLQLDLELDEVVLADAGPFCVTSAPVALAGTPPGGTYSGPGVSGNMFSPAVAGPGMHTIIYSKEVKPGCVRGDTITIQVFPASAGGVVTASTTVCSGSNSGTLSLSGNVGIVVKWQRSVDGGATWIDIANTTASQGYSNLTQTTMFRAVVQSGVCNPANSSPATITVDPVSVGGAVTADATVCSGSNSGTLSLSGNVGVVVKWQQSIDGGTTWTDIANTTTSQGYNNLTQTTMFRAVVQSGVCNPANSSPATITVDPVSVGGAVTADATVCSGSNSGTLSLSGNVGVVVKWQQSIDGGTTWTDIANTTASQGYSNLTQTTMFRAVVQSGVCNSANSSPATITVDPVSVGGAVTADATVCSGSNSGTLSLSGNVGAVVKWQQSIDGGTTWTDIANTTASQGYSNLTQTTMFRAVVQSGVCNPANSSPATITVDPVSVGGAVTADATVCSGSNSGTLSLSGNIGVVVKWQQSIDGGTTWTDIANTTTSQGYNNLTQTTMFRAVVQSGVCNPANSSPATITVDPVSVGGAVTADATVCSGSNSGTLSLSGNVGVVVKWQQSIDGGATWTDIANTTASQGYSNLTQTTMFRAVVQSGVCNSANSSPATITVDPISVGGAVTADATVCSGSNSGTLNLSGNVGTVVKWQRSVDGGATWIDIANTTASQGYSNLTQNTMFRAVVQSGVCNSANSSPATITVDPVSVGGAVTADATVCSGSNSGTLNLSGNVGAVVKWQRSVDGGATWIDIANTTASQGYSNLTQTTMFRAVVQSGVCNLANSSPATITVDMPPVGGDVNDTTLCNTQSATLTLSGYTGTIVMWQSSANSGATWTNIANTGNTLNVGPLAATTWYRAVIASGVCPNANSAPGIVTITSCLAENHCTYTQGFYGNSGGVGCNGGDPGTMENSKTKMLKAFDLAGINKVVFGKANIGGNPSQDRAFTLFRQDIVNNNIYIMLPGGGTAAVLGVKAGGTAYGLPFDGATYSVSSTWTAVPLTPSGSTAGKIKNVLLAQTMTLFFNMNNGTNLGSMTLHDSLFITAMNCATGDPIPGAPILSFALPHNVLAYMSAPGSLYPLTVAGLYQLANDKLGGVTINGLSPGDINVAVDAINNAFDGCKTLVGYYDLPQIIAGNMPTATWQSPGLAVVAYPNPFTDKVVFRITAQTSSPCEIEIYNMIGQRVQTLNAGNTRAGEMQLVEFNVPTSLLNGNFFYVVKAGDQRVSGKLINIRQNK